MNGTLRRMLGLVWPFRGEILLAALMGVGTVGSGVGLMAVGAFLIASAALHPPLGDLQVAIVGVRFFGISRAVCRYAERLVSHRVTFRLLARLRVWFYRALEPLAPARLTQYRSGDLLSRVLVDVESLEEFYVRVLAPPLVAMVVAAGIVLFTAWYSPLLGVLVLTSLAATGIAVPWGMRRLGRKAGRGLASARAAMNQAAVDAVQGMADLVVCGGARAHRRRMDELGGSLAALQSRMEWLAGLQESSGTLLAHLAVWLLVVLGIPMVREGRFNGVGLAVLSLAVLAAFEAVAPLPDAARNLEGQMDAARRVFGVLDAKPVVEDPKRPEPVPAVSQSGDTAMDLRNVTFTYPGTKRPAVQGIRLAIPAGTRVAVVGPSGAGKSTLAHLLLRFWDPQEGTVLLGGRDIRRVRQEDLRRSFGVVSQETWMFSATVRENLLLARPGATLEELERAAQRAHVLDVIRSLPNGWDTWIGDRGRHLSGGERRRVAIARALLQDPPLLLLDEPTAHLDTLTERDVLDSLHELMEDRTTLLITHRLVRMDRMDEIVVLNRGTIVERGRHSDLLTRGGLYARMWELQRAVLPDELPVTSGER